MKFTEEQFNTLVLLQKKYFSNNVLYPDKDFKSLVGAIRIDEKSVYNFIVSYHLENQTVALMNPLTREWAHEQFVEKEKKFVWTSKKMSSDGTRLRLQNTGTNGVVRAYGKYKDRKADWTEHLTEAEIKAWGYNPDMFDKEEVE